MAAGFKESQLVLIFSLGLSGNLYIFSFYQALGTSEPSNYL